MLNLTDNRVSYLLVSSDKSLISYLYSRDYHLLDIKEYHKGQFGDSILAFSNITNNDIRKDALHILEHFGQNYIIVKYHGEDVVKRVFESGVEYPMGVSLYNTYSENISYIYEGLSFSFIDKDMYYFPKNKSDFKVGMIVEFFSNNKWCEKKVVNPENEYDKMYSILIKYNKVRIPI